MKSDIVDGLIKIHEKEKWGFIFEFGRGKNYSILDIAKMFGGEITFLDDKPGEAQTTLCDSTLANIHLNWYPKINIEDYIKSYIDK